MSRRRRPTPRPSAARSLSDSLYPTLDLHGRTADEAVRAGELWLRDRQLEGDATVRLITGRGLHSIGPAVLPGAVESLLRRLSGSLVRDFERESGGGAFRVRLRPPEPARPSRPAPELPPEIVRLAEASLAELGIAPTPALVQAEARRILRDRELEPG